MKLKRRKIRRGRIEIVPMIDTIVILLIFYMTFSRFAEATREANLKLPESRAGDEFKQLPNQIVLNMYNADEVFFAKTKYKVADVPALVQRIKQQNPKLADISIILRGNRNMTYTDLSAFMKACARAGIDDVTFTTLEAR
jgi:biopolymer transport protein ExbD